MLTMHESSLQLLGGKKQQNGEWIIWEIIGTLAGKRESEEISGGLVNWVIRAGVISNPVFNITKYLNMIIEEGSNCQIIIYNNNFAAQTSYIVITLQRICLIQGYWRESSYGAAGRESGGGVYDYIRHKGAINIPFYICKIWQLLCSMIDSQPGILSVCHVVLREVTSREWGL